MLKSCSEEGAARIRSSNESPCRVSSSPEQTSSPSQANNLKRRNAAGEPTVQQSVSELDRKHARRGDGQYERSRVLSLPSTERNHLLRLLDRFRMKGTTSNRLPCYLLRVNYQFTNDVHVFASYRSDSRWTSLLLCSSCAPPMLLLRVYNTSAAEGSIPTQPTRHICVHVYDKSLFA